MCRGINMFGNLLLARITNARRLCVCVCVCLTWVWRSEDLVDPLRDSFFPALTLCVLIFLSLFAYALRESLSQKIREDIHALL
jgi:hypothetical protein